MANYKNMALIDRCNTARTTKEESILLDLANDEHPAVRLRVAGNRYSSYRVLSLLGSDENIIVLEQLVINWSSTEDLITQVCNRFSKRKQFNLKKTSLNNPNCPFSFIEELSRKDTICKKRIARHPKATIEILIPLLFHVNSEVRKNAFHSLSEILQKNHSKGDSSAAFLHELLFAESYSKEIEQHLMANPEPVEKLLAASNLNTPPHVLSKLAKEKSAPVREAVARNGNTPKDTLDYLHNDRSALVRIAVAMNYNTPFETLKRMAKREKHKIALIRLLEHRNISEEIIKTAITSKHAKLTKACKKALLIPCISEDLVEFIYKQNNEGSFDPEITCLVVANPKCPIWILEKEVHSSIPGVVNMALKTIRDKLSLAY